jgi:hypothetical protein
MLSSIRHDAQGLPIFSSASCLQRVRQVDKRSVIAVLTVVALSDSILNPSALCQVGDLGPILIWVRAGTESAT